MLSPAELYGVLIHSNLSTPHIGDVGQWEDKSACT